ncbi:MAG: hypothetical protein PHY54_08525 [Methylococcales bacterium]|nr:hypothetical protein [Methylococcales bacterium]
MKNLSGICDFLQKNIKAVIHSHGYKIVKIKKRNSRKISTRLASQNGVGEALFDKHAHELVNKNKYFTVQVDARPGINHLREALEWLVRESISLNRTPLVFTPHFDSIHNYDIEVNATWDKYIDLGNLQINNILLGTNSSIQAVMEKEIAGFRDLSILWIERDHILTDKENEEFDIIVRHNRTGLEIKSVHAGVRGLPDYSVCFMPSHQVLDTYNQVSNKLQNYSAMHVRRGDMLGMNDVYPNLDQETQPDKIKATISQILPSGSKIYILTNERDKAFFDPLKTDYEVLQYFDFPELIKLVECEQPDNFLLFEIEKLIFENAKTKIYTFTHRGGEARISLSSSLGWA